MIVETWYLNEFGEVGEKRVYNPLGTKFKNRCEVLLTNQKAYTFDTTNEFSGCAKSSYTLVYSIILNRKFITSFIFLSTKYYCHVSTCHHCLLNPP